MIRLANNPSSRISIRYPLLPPPPSDSPTQYQHKMDNELTQTPSQSKTSHVYPSQRSHSRQPCHSHSLVRSFSPPPITQSPRHHQRRHKRPQRMDQPTPTTRRTIASASSDRRTSGLPAPTRPAFTDLLRDAVRYNQRMRAGQARRHACLAGSWVGGSELAVSWPWWMIYIFHPALGLVGGQRAHSLLPRQHECGRRRVVGVEICFEGYF